MKNSKCFYPYEGIECVTEVSFTKTVKGFFPSAFCLPKKRPLQLSFVINGEKLLHHLVMVAKLLDDDKLKTLLKKWGCTVSTFIDLIQFEIERTVSMFRKKRGNFCVMFTYSIKQVRKIGKFHIAVVQRWLKNVQNSVMNMQSHCFSMPIAFLQISLLSPPSLLKLL